MGNLRFAILKTMNADGEESIALEYDQEKLIERIKIMMGETLTNAQTKFKTKFTKTESVDAFEKAFTDLVAEFKAQTVRIR